MTKLMPLAIRFITIDELTVFVVHNYLIFYIFFEHCVFFCLYRYIIFVIGHVMITDQTRHFREFIRDYDGYVTVKARTVVNPKIFQ